MLSRDGRRRGLTGLLAAATFRRQQLALQIRQALFDKAEPSNPNDQIRPAEACRRTPTRCGRTPTVFTWR